MLPAIVNIVSLIAYKVTAHLTSSTNAYHLCLWAVLQIMNEKITVSILCNILFLAYFMLQKIKWNKTA